MSKYLARSIGEYDITVSDGTEWGILQWFVFIALITAAVFFEWVAVSVSVWFLLVTATCGIFAAIVWMGEVFSHRCYVIETPLRIGFSTCVRKGAASPEHENHMVCTAIDEAEKEIRAYISRETENVTALKKVSDCPKNQ